MTWATLKTIELGVEKKRLVNMDLIVKVRKTEESDGEYHTKHKGLGLVFMSQLDVTPENFEKYAIVGELLDLEDFLKECHLHKL